MAQELDFDRTEAILDGMHIPEQPQALLDIRRELGNEHADIGRVVACIEKDVGLAALVLRTVNSPFFGCARDVQSLSHATMMLGLQNIANVVTGLALRRSVEQAGGPQPKHFWKSPANVALLAAQIARRLTGVSPDEAYMAGLFRDVGEAMLAQRFPDYLSTIAQARAELDDAHHFTDPEDRRFDTNHAVVSYWVSRSWGLPAAVCNVIRDHHVAHSRLCGYESDGELALLAVLKVAEHVDERFWGTEGLEWSVVREPIASYFGMSEVELGDLVEDLLDMLASSAA